MTAPDTKPEVDLHYTFISKPFLLTGKMENEK